MDFSAFYRVVCQELCRKKICRTVRLNTLLCPRGSFVTSIPERIKENISRSVSKNGDFDLAFDEIGSLSGSVSKEQVVELYIFIRDHSDRMEEEWRDEFIEFFPEFEESLPQVQYG